MIQAILRACSQRLGLSLPSFKVLGAVALSALFSLTIVACSQGSITSQQVAGAGDTPQAEGEAANNNGVGATLDQILSRGSVRVAVPQDSPPFGSVGSDGQPRGYDIEVARMIAEALEVEVELVPVTSTNRIPYLQTNRVDLVVSSLGATPERAKSIYFSSLPYAPFFSGVYGAENIEVADYDDLAGFSVGVTQGSVEDIVLSNNVPDGVEVRRFEDNSVTVSALLANQVELIATGNTIASQVIQDNPDASIDNKFVMQNSPCYVGVRRGDLDMLQWINVFIRNKLLAGEFEPLSEEWFGESLQLPMF